MTIGPIKAMPLPVALAFGAVGLALLALGARDGWVALRYRTQRPVPIGDLTADAGRVVVSGVARRADEVIEAPLTGRECLAYAWRVTDLQAMRRIDGEIGTWGQRGESGREAVPFLVDDYTGRVLVDPDGAEVRLAEESVRDPRPLERDDDPTLRDLVEDLSGVETYDRRFYEGRLEEGETVTVRGRVRSDDRLEAGRLGVSVSGGGALVADGTPGAAAGRALRRAAVSAGAGLFVLAAVTLFSVV